MVQIPLGEKTFSPLRIFFWREPLNPSLPLEKMLISPLKEAAALYKNQVWALMQIKKMVGFEHCLKWQKSGLLLI